MLEPNLLPGGVGLNVTVDWESKIFMFRILSNIYTSHNFNIVYSLVLRDSEHAREYAAPPRPIFNNHLTSFNVLRHVT